MITIYKSNNYQEIELFRSVLDNEEINSFVKGGELNALKFALPENDALIELCVSEKDLLSALYLLKLPLTEELLEIIQRSSKLTHYSNDNIDNSKIKNQNFGNTSILTISLLIVGIVALLISYFDIKAKYNSLNLDLNSDLYVYSEYDNVENCILSYYKENDKLSSWICYGEDGQQVSNKFYDINGKIEVHYFHDIPSENFDHSIAYDVNGLKTAERFDTDHDNRFDKTVYFDELGKEIRSEIDRNSNGRIEKSEIINK
ncbi:hypothetical protein [Leptospira haakeii]|uniref:EF-hand domain-containing protein n=1 Tax=Leptospira haakeii TaxID=2023198 RepID=A0ABX4PNE4_9LEPT|nr:hypothetical protein [Leptospira haakeii]PKA16406.1 hypothetical protein CH363_09830 [Leptospira haakeii]PKA19712.1 hypothetical protein CH377_10015 [Leptospira haakeii]